jgi:hypothetical protein
LSSAASGQNVRTIEFVPGDPLELIKGPVKTASAPDERSSVLQLLGRARDQFALRSTRQAFDLKVSFTVNSLGVTNYDGEWEMEDLFAPGKGHRWTAQSSSGYTITAISSAVGNYSKGTASAVPLRLQEARGVLFDPLPSPAYASRGSIRTAAADYRGTALTCVLFSRSQDPVTPASGRAWEETEDCIDPQSGLLRTHSDAPGHYAIYDYSQAPQLNGHVLPRNVIITEGGRIVSRISVGDLRPASGLDPSMFVATDAMKSGGAAIAMTSTTRVSRIQLLSPSGTAVSVRPVYVFGVVTATGQLVEAHSLQPSDPNSEAAIADAKGIDFSPSIPAGVPPRQHFVFVIEKFVSQ